LLLRKLQDAGQVSSDIGSLTQAAEVLHIAQPALSQQVATLENELDQQPVTNPE
jgi:DNA-binding transcriptional LysR family regulator